MGLEPGLPRARSRSRVIDSRSAWANERRCRRALVDLPALDADPTVLDHVDPAPPVAADDLVQAVDETDQAHLGAVDGHGHALMESDD